MPHFCEPRTSCLLKSHTRFSSCWPKIKMFFSVFASAKCIVLIITYPVLHHDHIHHSLHSKTSWVQIAHGWRDVIAKGKVLGLGLGWAKYIQPEIVPELAPWLHISSLSLNFTIVQSFGLAAVLRFICTISPAVTNPWLHVQVPVPAMTTPQHFFLLYLKSAQSWVCHISLPAFFSANEPFFFFVA